MASTIGSCSRLSPISRRRSAARVRAGAVLRPSGSMMMPSGDTPTARSWSTAKKRWASLQTMSGISTDVSPSRRRTVCWSMLSSSTMGKNCLGCCSRDRGQSRVPEPPAIITGYRVTP